MPRQARRRGGRWRGVIEPLFPGYLFIELDIEIPDTAAIRSIRGAIGLVRFSNPLQALPDAVIDSLREAQRHHGEAIDPARLFRPGDEVTPMAGLLAGLRAVFEAQSSQERLVILLEMLGAHTQVQVSPHDTALAR